MLLRGRTSPLTDDWPVVGSAMLDEVGVLACLSRPMAPAEARV